MQIPNWQLHIIIADILIFSCDQAARRTLQFVCLPIRLSLTPFLAATKQFYEWYFYLPKLILASMFIGRVCYLPKFTFWQVYSLVVFVTCQNLHFGKYVGWSCLLLAKITILASMLVGHVCLFVCTEISQNLKNDSVNHHQTWSQASTSP